MDPTWDTKTGFFNRSIQSWYDCTNMARPNKDLDMEIKGRELWFENGKNEVNIFPIIR